MSSKKNNDSSVSRAVVVQNQLGLHARPASMFVKKATGFESEILVEKDGEEINGKSIMGLMMLAAGRWSLAIIISTTIILTPICASPYPCP